MEVTVLVKQSLLHKFEDFPVCPETNKTSKVIEC